MHLEALGIAFLLLSLFGLLVGLLERTHRRATAWPTAFRPNAAAADADLRRLRDDLSASAAATAGHPRCARPAEPSAG